MTRVASRRPARYGALGDERPLRRILGPWIKRANAVIAVTPLGMPPRQHDPQWKEWGIDFPDLRYIMLWVIGETACHAGHLDAVAELIDGRQWIVLGS